MTDTELLDQFEALMLKNGMTEVRRNTDHGVWCFAVWHDGSHYHAPTLREAMRAAITVPVTVPDEGEVGSPERDLRVIASRLQSDIVSGKIRSSTNWCVARLVELAADMERVRARFEALREYVGGVEPVEIVLGGTWEEPRQPDWEIWAEDRTQLLGNGPALEAALDAFVTWFNANYPLELNHTPLQGHTLLQLTALQADHPRDGDEDGDNSGRTNQ